MPAKKEMNKTYFIEQTTAPEVPIILSVPHSGTAFPDELKNDFKKELTHAPDDTDWFVHKLYDFAPALGITMIHANYSRWVIDLNRDPESKPLYNDGRIITALCPTTTFFGASIYNDERKEVEQQEVDRRVQQYYKPYHSKLAELIEEKKEKFGKVLLWDCHSIRQHVPTIYKEKFPDLILGNADGTSASEEIINIALNSLQQGDYSVSHNHPFKGGYITRNFGKPAHQVHALQLEMSKTMYMDDQEQRYSEVRANKMRDLLKAVLTKLIIALK
jgi:N-formylglutamate amidohydrolase